MIASGGAAPREPEIAILALHGEATESDIRGLAELIERTTEHDGHRPVGEHALIELQHGPKVFEHAAFVARIGEKPVGYAHLSARYTEHDWRLELFTAPEQRRSGIGRTLMDAVVAHVSSHGGGRLGAWAYRPGPAQERLAALHGGRPVRRIHRMELTLPAPALLPPEGLLLRTFRAGEDEGAWLACHNETFAGHPDGGGWRIADLAWHLAEPWFDPDGFILAEDQDGLVGYCWIKLEGTAAWVYFLGVHPRARGRGLGAPLSSAGLVWAAGRGAERGLLYVDEGAPAIHAYERLGFQTHHTDVCYEIVVPAP